MLTQFKLYIYGAVVALALFAGWYLYQAGYRAATGDMAADTLAIQNAAIEDARRKSEAAEARVADIERAFQASLSREAELRHELANLPDSGARFSDDELRALDRLRELARGADPGRVQDGVR